MATSKENILIGIAAILTALGIVAVFAAAVGFVNGETLSLSAAVNPDKVGQLGDFIGGVAGSLWALAGVILFYVALKEQRNDFQTNQKNLELQNQMFQKQIEEFEKQKVELEETRKIFAEQAKTQKLQRFEHTFFELMKLHADNVDRMSVGKLSGRVVFQAFSDEAIQRLRRTELFDGKEIPASDIERFTTSVFNVYNNYYRSEMEQHFGHYLNTVANIAMHIRIGKDLESLHYNQPSLVLRAQLSQSELFFLYFYVLNFRAGPGLMLLFDYFGLLDDFKMLNQKPFKQLYDYQYEKAFKVATPEMKKLHRKK
ncbi:MAG: hypothetical protein K9J06_09885 [Flavobacteriales bacterium]|nr:hypothetical protein [Flavobacteriales bacterium]